MRGPVVVLGCFLVLAPRAHAQVRAAVSVPNNYHAVSNRTVYEEPPLPSIGAAGSRITDPTFFAPILRITDASVGTPARPTGNSFSTPSAAHQLAWNATSDRFYVRSISGFFIPYSFDASTMTAARIGTATLQSHIEPQFSFLNRDYLFAGYTEIIAGEDHPFVHRYNFSTGQYERLLTLDDVAGATPLGNTYVGAISSSSSPEKLAVMFGGCCQDAHRKVAVFDASSRTAAESSVIVLDTVNSRITRGDPPGAPQPTTTLGFRLHHAWIDRTGRYVVLYPVNADPVPFVVWDTQTDTFTFIPETSHPFGHDSLGFAWQVNQDCCTTSDLYDGAQWQLRSLATPLTSEDLIRPTLTPREVFVSEHTSWNNAQADRQVPVLSALFRYSNGFLNNTPWRAWDDEIVAIATESPASGATVWRFAHHRSDIADDGDASATYFWYEPRAVISPDGRWALFTSNWEKSLGAVPTELTDWGCQEVPRRAPCNLYRSDVFLVGLSAGTFTDDPLTSGLTRVKAIHFTELRTRIDVLRVNAGLGSYPWTDPGLAAGFTVRAVHLNELRTALTQAYVAAGRPAPTFSEAVGAGTIIRAAQIEELRQAIVALEGS